MIDTANVFEKLDYFDPTCIYGDGVGGGVSGVKLAKPYDQAKQLRGCNKLVTDELMIGFLMYHQGAVFSKQCFCDEPLHMFLS